MATHSWSAQQRAIFTWFETSATTVETAPDAQTTRGSKHLVVRARAGTGKTTTIIEGINRAPEQRILLAAFNKRIQVELASKIANPNAEALTLHSIGYRAVRRYWEKIGLDTRGARANALAEEVCGQQAPDALKRLVAKLCTKARECAPFATDAEELYALAVQFDCAPDDAWKVDGFDTEWVCTKAVAALFEAAETKPVATGIDFADMLFLPLRNRWLRPIYDLVVIDEAQDMTEVQLALAQGVSSGRIAVVGDNRQAVYAFRGADSESLDRLKTELGAVELGLNTTYRCGQVIVREAQRIVPDYVAGPSNPEGVISTSTVNELFANVRPGDFVLSRINAPLVSIALGLVRRGVRAKIEGRDIGAGLRAIVNKNATGPAKNSTPKFLERLGKWRVREVERATKAGLDNKVEQVTDQYETLVELSDGISGIPELLTRLENLFADRTSEVPSQVVCSSVHRAKGLEADRVWVLKDTLNPPVACVTCRKRPKWCACGPGNYQPDPVAQVEEQNLAYVAITRAKHALVWVAGKPGGK